jgi:uncharacterized coiled-coil protein SlyX
MDIEVIGECFEIDKARVTQQVHDTSGRLSNLVIDHLKSVQVGYTRLELASFLQAQADALLREKTPFQNCGFKDLRFEPHDDSHTIIESLFESDERKFPVILCISLKLKECEDGRLSLEDKPELRHWFPQFQEYRNQLEGRYDRQEKLIESLTEYLSRAQSLASILQEKIDTLKDQLTHMSNGSEVSGTRQSFPGFSELTQSLAACNLRDEFEGDLPSLRSIAPESAGSGSHLSADAI